MNDRARAALGGSPFDTLIIAISCLEGLVLAPVVLFLLHRGFPPTLEGTDFVIGALVLTFTAAVPIGVLYTVMAPRRVTRELEKLASLPFAFDRDDYLAILGEERSWMSFTFQVALSSAASPATKDRIRRLLTADASANVENVVWVDDTTLRFSSPTIDTTYSSGAANVQSWRSNERVHQWFSRHAILMLRGIHSTSSIARVALLR